jgi:Fe-S-cluster containining protein
MGVRDLDPPKDPGTRCPHVCSRGCRIYRHRPQSCRDFACLWRLGSFPEPFRPDKVGVCFSVDSTGKTVIGFIDASRPHAWLANERLVAFLKRVSRSCSVALGLPGTGKFTHMVADGEVVERPPEHLIDQSLTVH